VLTRSLVTSRQRPLRSRSLFLARVVIDVDVNHDVVTNHIDGVNVFDLHSPAAQPKLGTDLIFDFDLVIIIQLFFEIVIEIIVKVVFVDVIEIVELVFFRILRSRFPTADLSSSSKPDNSAWPTPPIFGIPMGSCGSSVSVSISASHSRMTVGSSGSTGNPQAPKISGASLLGTVEASPVKKSLIVSRSINDFFCGDSSGRVGNVGDIWLMGFRRSDRGFRRADRTKLPNPPTGTQE